MRFRRISIIVLTIIFILLSPGDLTYASALREIKANPNYLVILVPGKGEEGGVFAGESDLDQNLKTVLNGVGISAGKGFMGDLKGYLDNDLGLKGYVYTYSYSYNELGLPDRGAELGNRLNENCFLEKAKQEFIASHPIGTPVPEKYVLIGHSMGGLAIRHYIFGKGDNGEKYYHNDVKKAITIATPHLGSDSSNAIKTNDTYWANIESVLAGGWAYAYITKRLYDANYSVFGTTMVPDPKTGVTQQALTINNPFSIFDPMSNYLDAAAIHALIISPTLINTLKGISGNPDSPAAKDLRIDSTVISELKEATLSTEDNPVEFRLISGRGTPTPNAKETDSWLWARPIVGVHPMVTLTKSGFNEMPTDQERLESLLLSFTGAIFTNDGDLFVPYYSGRGEGIASLKDAKRYDYLFEDKSLEEFLQGFPTLVAGTHTAYWSVVGSMVLFGVPYSQATEIAKPILLVPSMSLSYQLSQEWNDRNNENGIIYNALFSHGTILKKVYENNGLEPTIIDLTLFDNPIVNVSSLETDISVEAYNSSQAIVHTNSIQFVKIENLSQSNLNLPSDDQFVPFLLDGSREAYLEPLLVKTPVTQIKGILYDFKPLDLKEFKISENFAGWQDFMKPENIKERTAERIRSQAGKFTLEMDNWGRFTISGFDFAEGQNVVAFKLKNRALYTSNQILKVTQNTIPQFVSKPYPDPGTSTNNVYQKIGVEANKANYSNDPSEKISVISFQVDGIEKLAEANVSSSQETNKSHTLAEWTPKEPWSDGQHDVLVKFQSNVGVSQAIWNFNVDTIPPAVSVGTLEAYAPRAPGKTLNIKYSTSDNFSQFLKNLSIRLYKGTEPNEDTNFAAEITKIATQAAGEQFVTWDGKNSSGNYVEDGIYTVRVKAFDQADNWSDATTQVKVDSTAPRVFEAHISPNPMTKASAELGFASRISEKSMVILKLINLSEKQTTAYITQGLATSESGPVTANYTWRFDDPLMPNLTDGVYSVEVVARDDAGNESLPYIISNVRIDRTPPVIFAQHTDPFVLANVGTNPYSTILRYRLSESNDAGDNKQPTADGLKVKVKLYDENSGQLIWSRDGQPGSLVNENYVNWNASTAAVGKGAYRFQINAYDNVGNYSTAYATCVKDGIAPVISYPLSGDEVSGTITVRGTAMDPDWTNDLNFKEFRVHYQQGPHNAVINPGPGWKSDVIEVPEIYRDPASGSKNVSIRPVQNDATLAYFYTNTLTNDVYTILVIAEEAGGAKYASARTVAIKNDSLSASGAGINPAISLGQIPSEITFDGNNSLPISFTYGGKDINAYVEILKVNGAGTRETVYYKYFPKLTTNFYSGKPNYQSGNEPGYFIWQDEAGWHVRWNGEAGKEHRFSGSIAAGSDISDFTAIGDGVKKITSLVNWDRKMTGGEGGFDFKTNSTQLIITTFIDNDPSTYDDDFSSMVTPYFGLAKYQPASSPVIIGGITGQSSAGQTVNWDGKVESGAFVDSGDYVVRVRAEGADGAGLTMIEKPLSITTLFDLSNVKINSTSFNPIGLPDRVTVSYNISKDAHIALKVYKNEGINPLSAMPLATIEDGIQLGRTNSAYPHRISWRGNYPDKDGTQVVTSGEYILKLSASPADGSAPIEKTITPNIIIETGLASSPSVQLDQIGKETRFNGGTIFAEQGSSDYYWEAKASGIYYPPIKNCKYTLGIQGLQKATVYPYVPFAGVIHRGFSKVFGKTKVKFRFHGWLTEYPWWDIFHTSPSIATKDRDWEADYYSFEISKNIPGPFRQTFKFDAAWLGWEGITGADVSAAFYSGGEGALSFPLDDMENKYVPAAWKGYNTEVTGRSSRGIFKVQAYKRWENVESSFNRYCDVDLLVSLADEIEHSRLTNRYLPWFGFVNKRDSRSSDELNIPLSLTNVTKLGFPGRGFFNNPNARISGEVKAQDKYQSVLNNITNYKTYDDLKAALDTVAKESYFEGYSGSNEVTSGYDSYLSDEKFEFISITDPSRRDNSGNVIPSSGGFRQEGMRWTAWTDYAKSGDESPVAVKWPYDAQEIEAKNNELLINRLNYLKTNPQAYNIANVPYEIDGDDLKNRDSNYLRLNPTLVKDNGWFKRKEINVDFAFSKSQNKYVSDKVTELKELINPLDYVTQYSYSDSDKSLSDLGISYDKENNKNSVVNYTVPANKYSQLWATSDDPVLSDYADGAIKGGPEAFNKDGFSANGKSEPHYFWQAYKNNYLKYQNADNSKRLFWRDNSNSDNQIDNPNLVINNWQIKLKDEAGQDNQDLELKDEDVHRLSSDSNLDDYFQAKLRYYAKEKRLIKVTGRSDSPYELMYFDGQNWIKFADGTRDNNGLLAFWDVGRLCGRYTVLLKTTNAIAAKDVYIGDLIYYGIDDPKGENLRVSSVYKRAEVFFKPASFSKDEFASVTPVTISQIYIRNRPIITTHGPIVELKPSPYKFRTPADGEEGRPYLRFSYTADDLKEGYGIVTAPDDPDWKIKTQDLWLHQVTAKGDLEPVQNVDSKLLNDRNGNAYFAFEAALDHFSDYTLLKGQYHLSAPIVFADRYITNKDTVTVYGTAEPNSILSVYVKTENIPPDPKKGEVPLAEMVASADKGGYRFEKVKLLREGENYIFVTSHLKNNPNVMTFGDVTIVKDTVPPSLEAKPNLYAFSPNDDGKYDSVDYTVKTNEKGKIYLSIADPQSTAAGQLFNEEIAVEPNLEYKINWGRNSLPSTYSDGQYFATVYAIDEAGNISQNVISETIVDTKPPVVLGLNADPNPFTPNDDRVKDTTKFWYKFSEPVYVKQNIYRDDGKLFKTHEGPTENFKYATLKATGDWGPATGDWVWDGRGSRNELIGGIYSYSIYAEDWVGNSVSSEVKSVVVDRVPTLIPYAYADPDPFAPVNPNNSFTEIKYYLGRDNLRVKAQVVGQEGRAIKTLARDEIQNRGEHIIRWYGDFDSGYTGMTASKNSYRVGDGPYEFKISAEDINEPTAKPAIVSNTVLVDNIPPNILIKNLAVDYLSKKALLAYSIPENASVEVYVYSKDGNLLATLISSEAQFAGEHRVNYSLSGEGENYFKLAATDRARNRQEIETSAFAANPNQFRIANYQAIPTTFTPNGDGRSDLTRISYNLIGGVPDYKVSINILNPAGATVKRLIADEAQNPGNYSFYWDGKTDSGQFAADGYYEYQILATDKLGASIEQRGTVLSVSTRPTIGLTTNQPVFSPNGDGSKDTVTFNYSINYPTFYISGEALVKIEVLNSTGEADWNKVFNQTAGSYLYEYNGLAANGLPLTAGNYYIKISAEDALGTTAITKTVPLQVDYAEPTVAIQSIAPDPFSPYLNGVKDQTVISYTLARPAYVSVRVKQGEAVVKTLQSNQWTEAYVPAAGLSAKNVKALGIPTLTWDGKDESGNFVADGSYSIEISAIDSAGNASTSSALITVDNTQPTIPMVDPLPANTNQGLQYITGSGEPNSLTKVYLNDNLISSGNASDIGSFSIPTNLFAGANNIKLAATDAAGNTSAFSTIQSVIYETDAPIISNLQISPNPAKAGPLTITFNVSETLESDPVVKVNTEAATFSLPAGRQVAGGWQYQYTYNVTNADQQGPAVISIEARDLADNVTLYQNNNLLTIDTINTNISNVDINVAGNPRGSNQTAYARSGSKVNIDFSVSESLLTNPVVKVGGKTATQESKTVFSSSRIDYSYSFTIGETDPDGTTPVTIEVTDLAGNLSVYSFNNSLIADQTTPEVSNLSASPNPASVPSVSGQVSIKFNVSEPLKEAPKVYVTQNGASPQLAVVGGQWTVVGGQCEAKYDAVTGNDGPALITIEVNDLAINPLTFIASFEVDTIKPVFSNVQSEISSNPEFTKFAREGSFVTMRFNTSEDLKFNPEVKVNGNLANYDSLNLGEYTYKYTITNADTNGNATLSIYGLDYALNEGTAETSSSSESFVIDLVNPTVAIADPSSITEWISNPASFATNEDPNNPNVHRSTTFYYKLAEDSKVTVKVHKVGDSQIAYTKSDFNDTTLIKTLVSDVWQDGGIQQSVLWNGTGNVGPGKYAFIVEGRDRANNLTLKKWGGTVWIQDNVLTLNEPDQFDFTNANIIPTPEVNPDPHYISPNGNSTEPAQKRARFYFMINLSLNPATTTQPEKIEALWTAAPIKKVGKYSVKVYSDSGLTNLVRTITSEADVYSASLTYEDWDGKTDGGQYAADGIYYMAVDVRDFAGNPAVSNLLTRSVVIDNTPPLVSNLAAAPYYFSPGNTESTIKTTTLTYEVSDNQNKAKLTIDVFKGSSSAKNLLSEVLKDNGTYSQTWDGSGSIGYVGTRNSGGSFGDGLYIFRVSAVDEAGNISEIKTKEVYVDTMGPNQPSISSVNHFHGFVSYYSPPAPAWSIHGSPRISWTNPGDNGGSGTVSYEVSIDGGLWSNLGSQLFWHGTLADGANRTVDILAVDALGNLGTTGRLGFKIDTVNPYFSSGPTVDTVNHTPINSWSKHEHPYITFTGADLTSGLREAHLYINGSDQGVKNSPWHQAFTDGKYDVRFRVYDNAGRFTDSSTYTFLIDITVPYQPSVTVGDTTPGVWSKHNSPVFTWNDPGDGSGSGVNYYRGFIDGSDQGNVSTGWHPPLTDGTPSIVIRAVDGVGYYKESEPIYFYIDTASPSVSDLPSKTFNPYDDGSVRVDFTASDPSPSSGFGASNITAKIKYSSNDVKSLSVVDDGGGNYHVSWDGTNNASPPDYENEGDYTLEISATDAVGNTPTVKSSMIYLRDDQRITDNVADSNSPYLFFEGSTLYLKWIEGPPDDTSVRVGPVEAYVETSSPYIGGATDADSISVNFTLDHDQNVDLYLKVEGPIEGDRCDYQIIRASDKVAVWSKNNYKPWAGENLTVWIPVGTYYLRVRAGTTAFGNTAKSWMKAWYYDRKYNQYSQTSSNLGQSWGSISGPVSVDEGPNKIHSVEQFASYGSTLHKVKVFSTGSYNSISYQRSTDQGGSWSQEVELVSLTRKVSYRNGIMYPTISCDASGNAYVAWTDYRDEPNPPGNYEIYFQKIPSNFARVRGTAQGSSIKVEKQLILTQSATLETPTLIAPKDKSENVQSIRPTFEWKHNKGDTTQYKLDLAKNDSFTIAPQTFVKSANTGSVDKNDPNLYYFNYSIHEFDTGLDHDTYFWRVTALSTSEAATSEAWSFTIQPDLTLTGITNYPNPFNPNKEKTKIRYRLSTDASEVKIRIYDITGSLVTELDGTTNGEGSSIWNKYNDVEWDGRNGRGDMVVNGIYPFEIIARLGDKTVSGRGKVAVLK